jgi:hypothetical protein
MHERVMSSERVASEGVASEGADVNTTVDHCGQSELLRTIFLACTT